MHRTETVDYGIVVSGEITLLLDDGRESVLRQGDVVIQRGTDHAWANRSAESALVAFVLIDGAFSDELTAVLPEGALARVLERPVE
jgi:quercetin dioxygenase-like cupin family protein